MIKKPNKPSSNLSFLFFVLSLIPLAVFFVYAFFLNWDFFRNVVITLLICLGILGYSRFKLQKVFIRNRIQRQDLLERNDLLQSAILKELGNLGSLQKKIVNYSQLKILIEKLNQCFSLIETSQTLSNQASQLFGPDDTTSILYAFHSRTGELGISSSQRGQLQINLKNKKGDIFDQWVVKTMQPLLVEDIRSDFRFNIQGMREDDPRDLRSLISVPLMVEDRALGILRVDSPQENYFNLEDLKFLNTMGSLGAIAVENVQIFERIEDLAIKDSLTGLYLRKHLMDRITEEISRSLRQKRELSFLMIDLDHFKDYNDRFGHVAGDIVLRTVAMILAEHFQEPGHLVCRYGGEEFCCLLPDCSKQKAAAWAEQLRKKIERQTIILRRQKTNVTISVGVATFPKDAQAWDELIHAADQAMYKAKNSGRNMVKIC